jgi:hypothetical protein
MRGVEVIFALATGLAAVWYGLYATSLVWLSRWYVRFAVASSKRLRRAFGTRTRASIVDGFDAMLALAWSTSLAVALTPVLLLVVPLSIGIGALRLTGALVHVRR